MMNIEHDYLALCDKVLDYGEKKADRTGTGTLSLFGPQIEHDMSNGFPLLTTKEVKYNIVLGELLSFIAGHTNANDFAKNGMKIWKKWQKDESGDLGPIYGFNWRAWPREWEEDEFGNILMDPVDQLTEVIYSIKTLPNSRRHVVSAWNVALLDEMALPPCHLLFQFYVRGNEYLDLKLYQRSADLFLGVPFNIASYATLLSIVAQLTDYKPGRFIHTFGDAHIYLDHIEQMKEQISRTPKELPTLKIERQKDIDSYTKEHFTIEGYNHHSPLKGRVSV